MTSRLGTGKPQIFFYSAALSGTAFFSSLYRTQLYQGQPFFPHFTEHSSIRDSLFFLTVQNRACQALMYIKRTEPRRYTRYDNRYRYRLSDILCFKKNLNFGPEDQSVGVFFRIRKFYLGPPSRPGIL